MLLQAYFKQARQAVNPTGGIFVMDLLGGHAAESTACISRYNEITGAHFVWEQEGFNSVTRHIRCYITLRDQSTRKVLLPSLSECEFAMWQPSNS